MPDSKVRTMLQYRSHEVLFLPYSVTLSQNNFSVAVLNEPQYEFSVVHKYGIITGNQDGTAETLKKPWSVDTTVPTGALVLSLVIFQTKTFFFQDKPVLVALSTRGPFIAFGGELESFPGFSIEELAPSADWSMYTCLALLGHNMVCIGNCIGQISVFRLDNYSKDGLVNCQTLHTSSRSKTQQLAADRTSLVAADSTGKVWSWNSDKDTFHPVLKGVPMGLTSLLNTMVLTDSFICLGFANGTFRLLCRDTGAIYCDAFAHAAALTAMAYNSSSQVLLTAGEDACVRAWAIDEKNEECKIRHLQHELMDDMMLCGVQFLNADGTRFGVVAYDRNELVTFKA